jgi:RNA polymerase sigma-70 factor (ECF subfamily)
MNESCSAISNGDSVLAAMRWEYTGIQSVTPGKVCMTVRRNPASEDIDFVKLALSGSQDAYGDLLTRYQRPVLSLVRRMVADVALAEDLAQEVFLKAFRSLHTFDQSRKFSSWLFKIAHNTAIDHLRRRQLDTVPLETPNPDQLDLVSVLPDSGSESPEEKAQRQDLAAAIEAAVASLRPEYREVVALRYQEGLPYDEIAEIADLPLGTVKTHLFRARKAMVAHLKARGWGTENG